MGPDEVLDPGPDIRAGVVFIDIRHPDTGGVGKIAEDVLELYEARGWERFEVTLRPEATDALVAESASVSMKREDLNALAAAAGVPDPESLPSKQAVLAAIAEADPTEPPSPDADNQSEED